MGRVLASVFVLAALVGARPTSAQEGWAPAGGWAEWLGLEPGRTLVYERPDGERVCARVGERIRVGETWWLPLDNLGWPDLASDSRVLLPLEGAPRLGVLRTPSPRPRVELLLPAAEPSARDRPEAEPHWGLPPLAKPGVVLDPTLPLPAGMADGWYRIGDRDDPELLVYVHCVACMDAGLRVVLERGAGIRWMSRTTLTGTEVLRRVEGGCAELPGEKLEVEVYVLPQGERRP